MTTIGQVLETKRSSVASVAPNAQVVIQRHGDLPFVGFMVEGPFAGIEDTETLQRLVESLVPGNVGVRVDPASDEEPMAVMVSITDRALAAMSVHDLYDPSTKRGYLAAAINAVLSWQEAVR